MSKRDYYEVLGVGKSATDAEIKSSYRKLALQYHPDRNKDASAADKFKEINEAYEVLGNPQKKQAYDQFGHAGVSGPGGMGGNPFGGQTGPFTYQYRQGGANVNFEDLFGGFSDPFDIFENFFGGSPFRSRQQKTHYSIELSFMDAINGYEKKIVHQGKSYTLKIPAGADNGTRIRYNDFDVTIKVRPDETFQREGNDIIVDHQIGVPLAVLGGDTKVPTLEGELKLKIKPGTQSGSLVRLTGKGARDLNGRGRGDFYIRFIVNIPTKLNKKEKELYQNLKNL